jgi:hypothetical protein
VQARREGVHSDSPYGAFRYGTEYRDYYISEMSDTAPRHSRLERFNERKEDILGPVKGVYPTGERIQLFAECPEVGWMEARFTLGNDVFPITFSDVYTPICDFVTWLDKIVADEPADPVWADDEDQDHYFHATPSEKPGILVFEYLRGHYCGDGLYRRACVGKKDLVREFYLFLNSLNNLKFEEDGTFDYDDLSEFLQPNYSFDFSRDSSEVIHLDLSKIEAYLMSNGILPKLPPRS